MPIARQFAAQQIERLAGIPAPGPQTSAALADLVDALSDCARSEAHARRTITEIIESPGDPPRWPTIATIRSVAWNLLTDDQRRHQCEHCNNTGWWHVEKPVWMHGQRLMYDFSGPCSCRSIPTEADHAALESAHD